MPGSLRQFPVPCSGLGRGAERGRSGHGSAGHSTNPNQRVRQALAQLQEPAPVQQLQKLCGICTATVCSALAEVSASGKVVRDARGYQLKLPFPVSRPIDPEGNGNGKWATANLNQEPQLLCFSGG